MAYRLKGSFRYYFQQAWPVAVGGRKLYNNWHIDAMCEHLQAVKEGHIKNLIINVPPRHTKSTTVSVLFPTWAWLDNAGDQFLCASHGKDLSTRDSVASRRLMESPWYQDVLCRLSGCHSVGSASDREVLDALGSIGGRIGRRRPSCEAGHWAMTTDQNVKTRYQNDRGGTRISTSVGAGATGEGGDYLLLDDPHDINDAERPVARKSVHDWFDYTWSTRKNDPVETAMVLIMQRVHEDDIVGHILANSSGEWDILRIPMEYEA